MQQESTVHKFARFRSGNFRRPRIFQTKS